jgi:hypothetical protein
MGTVVLSPAYTYTGILKNGYDTAQNCINQAATECGLTVPAGNNPLTSTDPAMGRLVALTRSVGAELMKMYEWQSKLIIYTLTTGSSDPGQYTLPSDFDVMIDQTGWQQSYFWPLRGPYSAQMWQRVVNYPTTGIYVAFRIQNDQLWLWPQPVPANIGITFMYKTRGWVQNASSSAVQESVILASDNIMFDWLLFVKFLKLRYLEAVGFDTTSAQKQFDAVFDMCTSQEQGAAPELELAKDSRFPFITGFNSPDTGFGGQPPAGGSYQ